MIRAFTDQAMTATAATRRESACVRRPERDLGKSGAGKNIPARRAP
jgi:hypothetical protein